MDNNSTNSLPLKAAFLGILLSFGAPLGYFVFTFLMEGQDHSINEWLQHLYTTRKLSIIYISFPTAIAFSLFGFFMGKVIKTVFTQRQNMDQLLHVVAHDIRSPLAAIHLSAVSLNETLTGPQVADQKKFTAIIERQVGLIKDLAEEILELERLENGIFTLDLKANNIRDLVAKTVDEMEIFIKNKSLNILLEKSLDSPYKLLIDSFKIRQVLRNLLSNAVKYTPENGQIIFSVHELKTGLEITCFNEGSHIPESKLNIIFNKFGQVSESDKKAGYGLGLAICKEIMAAHDGRIYVKNKDKGVSFSILFPRSALT